jgi:deazaflavin-dependent oxidoreductase (nitroreductase family)
LQHGSDARDPGYDSGNGTIERMVDELHPPRGISIVNAISKPLLAAGVPMAFNGLISIRGRKTGLPRTTPVAIIRVGDRRWVWSPWGEVNWVRNLRAAGRATITFRREEGAVRADELTPDQRIGYFRDVLGPLARSVPGGSWLIKTFDGVDLSDPVSAAARRPVFELHPIGGAPTARSA